MEGGTSRRSAIARETFFARRECAFVAHTRPVRAGARAPARARAAGRRLAARGEIRRLPDAGVAAWARAATVVAQPARLDGKASRDRGCDPRAGLPQLRAGWRAGGVRRTRAQPIRPAAEAIQSRAGANRALRSVRPARVERRRPARCAAAGTQGRVVAP